MCFLLFGYSLEPRSYSRVLGTVGSVMTIGLSYKGCSHLENQFDERKQDWPVHKFGLRRLKRLDAIQTVSFSAAHSRRQKEAQLSTQGHLQARSFVNGAGTAHVLGSVQTSIFSC